MVWFPREPKAHLIYPTLPWAEALSPTQISLNPVHLSVSRDEASTISGQPVPVPHHPHFMQICIKSNSYVTQSLERLRDAEIPDLHEQCWCHENEITPLKLHGLIFIIFFLD